MDATDGVISLIHLTDRPGTSGHSVSLRILRRSQPGILRDGPPSPAKSPRPAKEPQVGGPKAEGGGYFFLPWFLTASIAAAAASGSRYVPPGVNGLKAASSS